MARAYYFDYLAPEEIVNVDTAGECWAKIVVEALREYGVKMEGDFYRHNPFLERGYKVRGFHSYLLNYLPDGMIADSDKRIEMALTIDNKLIIDFKSDPLLPETANGEIVDDIRQKLIEYNMIQKDAAAFIAKSSMIQSNSATPASKNSSYKKGLTEKRSPLKNAKRFSLRKRQNGCYVATAIYGSYDCAEVWVLRRFRDGFLAKRWYGKVLIRLYYAISPALVRKFGCTEWFKRICRPMLDGIVTKLKAKGISNSPYNDCY